MRNSRGDLPGLSARWQRWANAFRQIASSDGHSPISSGRYEHLFNTLMIALELSRLNGPAEYELRQRMEDSSRPWVNIDAIRQSEPKVLKDQIAEIQHLQRDLRALGLVRATISPTLLRAGVAVVLVAVAVFVLVGNWDWVKEFDFFARLRDGSIRSMGYLRRLPFTTKLVVATLFVVGFGIWFMGYGSKQG